MNIKKITEALDIIDSGLDRILRESTISQVVNKLKNAKTIEQIAAYIKAGKPEEVSKFLGPITSDDGKAVLSNADIIAALKKAGIVDKQILNYFTSMRPDNVTHQQVSTAHAVTPSGKSGEAWKNIHTIGVI
jgi:hypothetical protein